MIHFFSALQSQKIEEQRLLCHFNISLGTGKSFSEALILVSINPQYDKRLFIELQVQYMKIPSSEHVVYTNCFFVFVLAFRTTYVHNMFYPCSPHVLTLQFSCM